jgi:Rho GTPase-activating protein RGD1
MPQQSSSFGPSSGMGYNALDSPAAASPVGNHSYGQSLSSAPTASNYQRPASQTQPHERSFSHGSVGNTPTQTSNAGPRNSYQQPPQTQSLNSRYNTNAPGAGSFGSITQATSGPPQLGTLPFQDSPSQSQPGPTSYSPPQSTGPGTRPPQQQGPPQSAFSSSQGLSSHPALGPSQPGPQSSAGRGPSPPATQGPARPVFGVSLQRLYERDGLAVPMVVYQCIQAVDLYGLSVEGIYRLSGSVPHVNKLKHMFDTGTSSDFTWLSMSAGTDEKNIDSGSSNLDFRNPENFFHDVNSVAGLLKQFFRDLPDSLLTKEHYQSFVKAARMSFDPHCSPLSPSFQEGQC